VECVRPLRRVSLVIRAPNQRVAHADSLDDEDLVHDVDISLRLGAQAAFARIDSARLQRAAKGPRQSTGGGCDDVIERRGMVRILPKGRAVVLAYLVMSAEQHRFWLSREIRPADRTVFANDFDFRDVRWPVGLLGHAIRATG